MEHALSIPENAWCRKCGYALRGLPRFVCPECGKPFDPQDARSFDGKPPGWRKKRWIKGAAFCVFLALVIFVFCPRGLLRSSISFECDSCGHVQRFDRIELLPATWIPIRYPGITFTQTQQGHASHVKEAHRAYHLDMKSDLRRLGRCSARYACDKPGPCSMNGILITSDSAPIFLYEMLAPRNTGIGP